MMSISNMPITAFTCHQRPKLSAYGRSLLAFRNRVTQFANARRTSLTTRQFNLIKKSKLSCPMVPNGAMSDLD